MAVLKSLGTPFRTCVRRAFWQYHYLRAFLGVDTGAPGVKSNWCIYDNRAIYGWEPHQWWWALWLQFLQGTFSMITLAWWLWYVYLCRESPAVECVSVCSGTAWRVWTPVALLPVRSLSPDDSDVFTCVQCVSVCSGIAWRAWTPVALNSMRTGNTSTVTHSLCRRFELFSPFTDWVYAFCASPDNNK